MHVFGDILSHKSGYNWWPIVVVNITSAKIAALNTSNGMCKIYVWYNMWFERITKHVLQKKKIYIY